MSTEVWYLLFNNEKKLFGAPHLAQALHISGLKRAIKEVAFSYLANVQAVDLVVWRCKEPTLLSTQDEDKLHEYLLEIDFSNREQVVKLNSGAEIADLELGKKEVLLVQVPTATNLGSKKRKLEEESPSTNFIEARNLYISAVRDGPSASYGAKLSNFLKEQSEGKGREVWNGRPLDYHAEPVGLYHPVFNEFHDAIENTEPFYADAATYDAIDHIFHVFSSLHKDENQRASAIERPLRTLLDRAFIATRASKVESDGVIVQPCGRSIAYLMIQELKNEIGEGSSDPYNQGSLAYQKYWSSEEDLVNRSCCPSIILAIAGPWMCVLGGIFVNKAIIQPLTDYIWLGGDPFDSTRQVFAARLFTALKSAILSLEKYYQALALGLPRSKVKAHPFITEYGADKIKFTYSSRLATENKYRLLYRATLDDVPNSPIIVKFVQRYNADAHRLLAAEGLAPKLHYSSTDDNITPLSINMNMSRKCNQDPSFKPHGLC